MHIILFSEHACAYIQIEQTPTRVLKFFSSSLSLSLFLIEEAESTILQTMMKTKRRHEGALIRTYTQRPLYSYIFTVNKFEEMH